MGARLWVWWRQACVGQACEAVEQGVARAARGEHTFALLEKRIGARVITLFPLLGLGPLTVSQWL